MWTVTTTEGIILESQRHPLSKMREQKMKPEDVKILELAVGSKYFTCHISFGMLFVDNDVVYVTETAQYESIEPIACEEHAVRIGTATNGVEATDSFQGYKLGFRGKTSDGETHDTFLRVDAFGVYSINTENNE